MKIQSQLLSFLPRAFLPLINMVYWLYLPVVYGDQSIELIQLLALSQIVAVFVPVGSNPRLMNQSKEKIQSLLYYHWIFIVIGVLFFILSLKLKSIESVSFVVCVALLMSFERVSLSYYLKVNSLSVYYLKSILGRAVGIGLLINFSSFSLFEVALIIEFISRLLLFWQGLKFIPQKPNVKPVKLFLFKNIKNHFPFFLITAATWLPMSFGQHNQGVNDYLGARIVLFILGFTSVFYIQEFVLNKSQKKFLIFVENKVQNILIGLIFILVIAFYYLEHWPILGSFLLKFSLVNQIYISLNEFGGLILLSLLFLPISWLGANTITAHSDKKEFKLALTSIIVSLLVTIFSPSITLSVYLVGLTWYLSVFLFYKSKVL